MSGKSMEAICPNPRTWHDIHARLSKAAMLASPRILPPPRPLILAGWNFSSDLEKKKRWDDTVEWANTHRLNHLIGEIPEGEMYKVDLGFLLMPLLCINPYPNWNYESKPPLPTKLGVELLARLRDGWAGIAGPIADSTQPRNFSGKKWRRLVVLADADIRPPWGSWSRIDRSLAQHFRDFRRSVNRAILPHEVDHIDFVHDGYRVTIGDTNNLVTVPESGPGED